jgi:hypothetical protein
MPSNVFPDDYYALLEIDQDADLDVITKAYKIMASKLHPDRSSRYDTTYDFQLISPGVKPLPHILPKLSENYVLITSHTGHQYVL